MIPLSLALKNFMSYRDPKEPVDFRLVQTACLSGDNGAGKSALFTAMTWALWGEVPAHTDPEDLIAQGESDMRVDFEFALRGQHYRVLRARARKGKTTTGQLTFQVRGETGWRDISGDTMRQTQQEITGRLHMDYETFVNSAFLRQGHADEFTTKNPGERKDILARILGLHEYDRLAERARDRARECDGERRGAQAALDTLDGQIARKPDLTARLAEVAAYLGDARETLAQATAARDQARLGVAAMEQDARELENVRGRAAQHESEISKGERAVAELEHNLARYQETLDQHETITANYTRLQAARVRERELGAQAREQSRLASEIGRLERLIDQERNKLHNAVEMVRRAIATNTQVAARRAAAEADLTAVRQELAGYAALEAEWQQAHLALDDLQRQVAELQGANGKLQDEAEAIKGKLKILEDALAEAEAERRGGQVPCPLCRVLMGPGAADVVRRDYSHETEARRAAWRANKRQIEAADKAIAGCKARIATLDEKLKPRKMAEKRETSYEHAVQAAVEAQTQVERDTTELQALEARFAAGDFAVAERAALAEAQAAQAALAYSPEEHRRVSSECHALEAFEMRFADLRSAQEKLDLDTARLAREREALDAHRGRLRQERQEEARLVPAVAGLAAARQQAAAHETMAREGQALFDRLSREEAALARQLEDVAAAEQERIARAAALAKATADKGVYEDLVRAFGKGGIQAMIIEQVVPELADDANELLARMTDNRMHLVFETQRQAKTRDSTVETLDIKITDGAGVARKYEMFSGGEAFRINFAVRIALSKLLARRAGAQLQTLIIDEGFGTQDAEGRERLVQAIRSIQPDFEKILVITHLDDMKDAFPSRIDVVKTAGGSVATVN